MKLTVNLNELFENVRKMGIQKFVDFNIDLNSKPIEIEIGELETSIGLEIPLEAVEVDPSGVFNNQGKQIILFIPDNSYNND